MRRRRLGCHAPRLVGIRFADGCRVATIDETKASHAPLEMELGVRGDEPGGFTALTDVRVIRS